MRTLMISVSRSLRTALAALLVISLPSIVSAQQSDSTATLKPGTVLHTVRPGDTLYDIARRYLGNPYRWPELFRANASQIANANLIYPGQKLFVGADGRPTFNPEGVAEQVPNPDSGNTRPSPLGRQNGTRAFSTLENATLSGRGLRPTVRLGEVVTAPFLVPQQTPLKGGSVVSRSDPTVVTIALGRDQFQLYDELNVLLPEGQTAAIGQEFGVFSYGENVRFERMRARLVRPTGVVAVVALGTGRAAKVRVTRLYGNIKRGDVLMAVATPTVPASIRPSPVANGTVARVAHVASSNVLPTVQNYIMLALPAGSTAKVGDLYVLYEEGDVLTAQRRDVAPESDVAQATIVRVGAEAATAIVVGHESPAIRAGMKARLVASMP
jgi:LysM repeat protein